MTAVVLAAALLAPPAFAGGGRARSVGKAASAIVRAGGAPSIRLPNGGRGGSPFPLLNALGQAANGGGRNSSPFPLLNALANGGGHNNSSPFPILDAINRAAGNGNHHNNKNDAQDFLYGLSQLGQYGGYGYPGYGGYGGYGGGYGGYGYGALYPYYQAHERQRADEEYADAIRDSAIAGAVSNVVSAIVTTQGRTAVPVYAQPQPVYTQPAPVYTQPAPVYTQPSPLGRYETRREKVGGGYYERQQILVPESRDPQTGNIIESHYETVRKWVPEVYQETEVWVAP